MTATMNAPTITPFVFDRDYENTEQVRPYLNDFMVLKNAGTFYNSDFKGKIPGLATTDSKNEDTAIYLLQTLAELERLRERTATFIATGGYRLTNCTPKPTERGTLVYTGFYCGGTGWSESQNVVVTIEGNTVRFKAPRQRNWRTHYAGPSTYLFMPGVK
jgi:hypothetical protein